MILTRQGRYAAALASAGIFASIISPAFAGGSPESTLLIVDPGNPTSMYVGNYYKNARNIPDRNVLYLSTGATDYGTFTRTNQQAFAGELLRRRIADHVDYVVIAPFSGFYVPYAGEPTGPGSTRTCGTPQRYSISAAYTLAQISADFLSTNTTQQPNEFYGDSTATALGFGANQGYLDGVRSTDPAAKKYYIGALLGYTGGPFGNSIPELLTLIDRSVAADGQRDGNGNFYYMNNTADSSRNVRACGSVGGCSTPTLYNAAVLNLSGVGFSGAVVAGILPGAGSRALGVMTGNITLGIPASSFTLAAGAFADHLTSWGALFDCSSGCQTPISAWIKQGASASDGTVEEPCAFTEVFPSAEFHFYYAQGMSIGESYLRSLAWTPTHNLLYGDPLTRAYAQIPTVTVANPPAGRQSGIISIAPSATTAAPGVNIAGYDLLVDGVRMATAAFGGVFSLDTRTLSDGAHDIRVLAYDDTLVRTVGRWTGNLDTSNYGRVATLRVASASGDLTQAFSFNYLAVGAPVLEVRLLQNERVLAASTAPAGTLTVYGQNLGAGTSNVQLEVLFADHRLARSTPLSVTISASGTPAGIGPVAYSYSKATSSGKTLLLELPASFDTAPDSATYTLLNLLTKATVLQSGSSPSGPYRIIQPLSGATGSEQLQFQVVTPAGTSNIGTITLNY